MACMVYERNATAVRGAYGSGRPREEIEEQLAQVRRARAWLESLAVDPTICASLVEPIAVVEDALEGLLRTAYRRDS
jgi:hypothetical protein